MKKFFSNIASYVLIAVVILVPLAIAFHEVYDVILAIGRGSLIAGIVITPFVIIGVINVIRGVGAVLEMNEAKYGNKLKNNWKFGFYALLHIGGYLALFYALIYCL